MNTKTVSVPVSELSGTALDWAVAKCEGFLPSYTDPAKAASPLFRDGEHVSLNRLAYSSDWSLAGPIIEREGIGLDFSPVDMGDDPARVWAAYDRAHAERENGPTPLIAAMRCYVASKLGDTVDIPAELA